jgi:hypothetical protein
LPPSVAFNGAFRGQGCLERVDRVSGVLFLDVADEAVYQLEEEEDAEVGDGLVYQLDEGG